MTHHGHICDFLYLCWLDICKQELMFDFLMIVWCLIFEGDVIQLQEMKDKGFAH